MPTKQQLSRSVHEARLHLKHARDWTALAIRLDDWASARSHSQDIDYWKSEVEARKREYRVAFGKPMNGNVCDANARIRELIQDRRMIAAIKLYRETYGTDLRTSQDACETIREREMAL